MTGPLALTLGEPAGIGPDITLAAWLKRAELQLPPFYVVGDAAFPCAPRQAARPRRSGTRDRSREDNRDVRNGAAGGRARREAVTAEPAHPDASSAPAAIASIRRAVAAVLAGRAHAVVTNPVAKSVLYRNGFAEPGHTEYLAKLAQAHTGKAAQPVMMLWSPELAVVPVTIHLPVREVPGALTTELIVNTGRIVARDLERRFAIAMPRLAVAGLNPHAGEDGTLGEEDRDIVAPAVAQLRADGIDARGPLPADTMFHAAARKTYDAALCDVSRSGADPDQDARLRPRRQRDARPALRAHLARSRHRVRHRRDRAREPGKSCRGTQARGTARKPGRGARRRAMSALDDLPPLRETIRRHGLSARKSLGQNFLLDLNLTGRIARAAGPLAGVTVVEVGPGPGGLTRALLAQGAPHVIAIERDERAVAALDEIAAHYPGRLTIVAGDALTFDVTAMLDGPARVVANLPYNIATALLVGWLTAEPWPPWYDRLTLMFQREVAERIVAKPGSKTYGRLSVLTGWRAEAKILFDIAPSAFVPPPKVTSSRGAARAARNAACLRGAHLERVTAAAFGQRRKMLRQSLKSLGRDPIPLLEKAGLDPTARAEDIPVEGFVALA